MPSLSVSLKYRPLRIGFLVREGNINDLVKASEINTLLWGGIYNPIIPIKKDNNNFAEALSELFSIDIVYPIAETKEIQMFVKQYSHLSTMGISDQEIFQQDYHSKKNNLLFLDSKNIIDYYWEKEFKNGHKSNNNCINIKWDKEDPLSNFFAITFGQYPTNYNLKDDFENAFSKGLKAKNINLKKTSFLPQKLSENITPINLTCVKLKSHKSSGGDSGIFIGNYDNFTDLITFWNLRAAGTELFFLPINKKARFKKYIDYYLAKLNERPSKYKNFEDSIMIYYSKSNEEKVKKITKSFKHKKNLCFSCNSETYWNGRNIRVIQPYFNKDTVLGVCEKRYERYTVTIGLPEKKFLLQDERRNQDQVFAVSIKIYGKHSYPQFTLQPPFIRKLNEFYSREISRDPFEIRVEEESIAKIIKLNDNFIELYPVSVQSVIDEIFQLVDIKSEISPSGKLTSQIIANMREESPLEACRVFKITGVRKMLRSMELNDKVSWNDIIKLIAETNFGKFQDLHIEYRKEKNLKPANVINFLLKKKVLLPHLNFMQKLKRKRIKFECQKCGLYSQVLFSEFEKEWDCPFCAYNHYLPEYIGDYFNKMYKFWKFKKGIFYKKEKNLGGAIPVILTLLALKRVCDNMSNFDYVTALNLGDNQKSCETDFCVLNNTSFNEIEVGIGEVKDEGSINLKDINNLTKIQEKLASLGINCYLIFSKTADFFTDEEIKLFKEYYKKNHRIILLTNKELEPYHPYWELKVEKRPFDKYAHDMETMAENSHYLYLK